MTRSRNRAVEQSRSADPTSRFPFPASRFRWLRVWWRAVRPFSFTASMTPVLVGSAVAFGEQRFHPGLFAAAFIASVAIHAGANLVDAILVVNNLRDLDGDRARGKRTLATFIGRAATRAHFLILVAAAYVSIALGVWLRIVPPLAGLAVVTIPDAVRIWRVIRAETDPQILTVNGIRATAQFHQRIGLLLALAFVAIRLK